MELSQRLQVIAEMVRYPRVADIGTDHGYVPIWLFLQGKLSFGIACDIHTEPLKRAGENIRLAMAQKAVKTRLGNGLAPVMPNEVDSVVIAGMGGMLIISILEEAKEVVLGLKELIVSPHLDVPRVRQYLHRIGFFIEKEHMLKEDGKFYTVIRAVPGQERYQTQAEYDYGKLLLENRDAVLLAFLQEEEKRLSYIHQKLQMETSGQATKRLHEIEEELTRLQEVLKWQCSAI